MERVKTSNKTGRMVLVEKTGNQRSFGYCNELMDG